MPRQFAQGPGVSACCGVKQSPALARLSLVPQKREFFGLYNRAAANIVAVSEIRLQAREQAHVIRRSAGKLTDAVALLEGFQDSRGHLDELRELEDVGDRILHDSVSSLFMARADALELIRWKDIHESLEEAVDACGYAANVLEAIVVKNR